jgi:histone H3/H4
VKNATKLNVSAEALTEIREYTEDIFIPKLVRLADRYATKEGKKTIQERDYLRAKDFMNKFISEVDKYE